VVGKYQHFGKVAAYIFKTGTYPAIHGMLASTHAHFRILYLVTEMSERNISTKLSTLAVSYLWLLNDKNFTMQ
jgi:hypothetical protein